MKRSLLLLFLFTFPAISINSQAVSDTLTSQDYDRAVSYLASNTENLVYRKSVNPTWLNNELFWYQVNTESGKQYILVDARTGKRKTSAELESLLAGEDLKNGSNVSKYQSNEMVSPDGEKVAYIKDWNLWMRDLESGQEIQLTKDGIKNYGYATDNAGWEKSDKPVLLWSPDSKKIATYRQDQRHVSDMYLVTTNIGAPNLQQWKYPLPQDEKAIQIERVIIDTEKKEVIPLKIESDPRRGTLCDNINCSGTFDDNEWSEDSSRLYFVSSSRDHKSAKLRVADATTGDVREIFEEKVKTQYESGRDKINWTYLDESNEIIWYSERDDYGHLYLYDARSGKLKNRITSGDFVVTEISYVDEDQKEIYFLANGKNKQENPYFSHLYKANLNGRNLKELTPEAGTHNISWSPGYDFFVDNYSTPTQPNTAVLKRKNGKTIVDLEQANIAKLKATGWKAPETITVKSANNKWDLYGLMFTPSNLDENKKYPVVNYVYPGPQGGSIRNWNFEASRRDHQALAELGFIVIAIEGSCNPGRTKSFHDA
ncbi:MAG: DPP IV N-terminal domain-containing protein, partial [Gramella sp.]|nr:DPP IV N-terminal domain-containing protein [Christiangramia sp.]